MANKVLDWVWAHSRSRHSARLVLLSLADSTNRPGAWTWPSIPELMARTGLGERAVQLATADLAAIGELEIQRNAGPGGCHRYRLTMKTVVNPAESAGGTVKNPKDNQSSTKTGEKAAKHAVADELADAFWRVHQSSTAQTFIAVRQVIRTAIANGLARNDVARALDSLAKESRAISGGTITTALSVIKGTQQQNGQYRPYRNPEDESRYDTEEFRAP